MAKVKEKAATKGPTPRASYRFTAVTLAQIEEMAAQDAAPTGATPNNTTTLARLVSEEYHRRAKAGRAKK